MSKKLLMGLGPLKDGYVIKQELKGVNRTGGVKLGSREEGIEGEINYS